MEKKKSKKINKHVYCVALAISPKSLAHSVHTLITQGFAATDPTF